MEIELKTGKKMKLEVSSLLLEYLEDYEGGLEQLKKDAEGQKDKNGYTKTMYATNQILYAVIASNSEEELTYRQAVKLVKLEDIEKIVNFVIEEVDKIKSNKIVKFNHRN